MIDIIVYHQRKHATVADVFPTIRNRSLAYIINNKGQRQEPCGTPHVRWICFLRWIYSSTGQIVINVKLIRVN